MINIKKGKKAINDDLRREFIKSSEDDTFRKLCNRLKLDDDIKVYPGHGGLTSMKEEKPNFIYY